MTLEDMIEHPERRDCCSATLEVGQVGLCGACIDDAAADTDDEDSPQH